MMRRLTGSGAGAALFAAALLLSWQILAGAGVISQIFFPSPSRTLGELYAQVVDGALWQPLGATALRMTYGWVAASLLGVVLGAVIGSSRAARDFLEPILEFMRPLPASAIIPVAILFLGLSNEMATAVIAFGAIWPVLLASVHGFASIEPQLVEVAQALRLSRWEFLRTVAVPGALPNVLAGARVSLAIALILAVVTECKPPSRGSARTSCSRSVLSAARSCTAGIVALGVLGFAANQLLLLAERRALAWRTAGGQGT